MRRGIFCVWRGPNRCQAARAALLPVGPDARVPMREIYLMFRGRLTDAQVIAAAGTDPSAQFFANLYTGLYLEASGNRTAARQRIGVAAQPRFAAAGGYMHDVARLHLSVLNK